MLSLVLTLSQTNQSVKELKLILKAMKDFSTVLFRKQPVYLTDMEFSRFRNMEYSTGSFVAKLKMVVSLVAEK